ncbi:hypothetical protein [Chromohalobacter nigrandesensis]|uniref:hypothetical protein n=1 Tax=Chromohalobacter nigrandesensis TaxID=119863 RepID=UPI001FF257E0|nr:hypothetical protein [Chromohalobacter nigrandesensis]MCK0743577.1 hypothetical protein [Chromohalobacter nigrandesensis]
MIGLGLLKSWRLWGAVAALAGAAAVVGIGLHQAQSIGELEAKVATKQAAIDKLGNKLEAQDERHQQALAARDAALVAARAHTRDAQARTRSLADEIKNARATDEQIDACMGMQLPGGIADRLRQ